MKIIIALLGASIVLSCKNFEKSVKMDKTEETEMTTSNFDLSPKTKMFLKDFKNESEVHKTDGSLSENFIEKYSLKKIENIYYFQGFATTNERFDKQDLEEIGIKVGSNLGKQTTLTIPLTKINDFLNLKSITYFEISNKTNLK